MIEHILWNNNSIQLLQLNSMYWSSIKWILNNIYLKSTIINVCVLSQGINTVNVSLLVWQKFLLEHLALICTGIAIFCFVLLLTTNCRKLSMSAFVHSSDLKWRDLISCITKVVTFFNMLIKMQAVTLYLGGFLVYMNVLSCTFD